MFIPKPPTVNSFEIAPAGTHVATCYRFIDRGTQLSSYQGVSRPRHEVMLSWEIADELMSDGRPFSVHKTYTWSMSKKSSLRRDLESWRGLAFTDADFEGPERFNTKKLLGTACVLTITHEDKEDGSVFAKITGIGKLLKGLLRPTVVNEMVYLTLDTEGWSQKAFALLSDNMREIVARSPEYQGLIKSNGSIQSYEEIVDDEVPF